MSKYMEDNLYKYLHDNIPDELKQLYLQRIYHALRQYGITNTYTLKELLKMEDDYIIIQLRNFGEKSLKILRSLPEPNSYELQMQELITEEDIFNLPAKGEAICITTNGIVKNNGNAVMGAGLAKQADELLNLSAKLGSYINQYGNRAFNLGQYQRRYLNTNLWFTFTVFSFPTKNHYKDKSDINLIIKSCNELIEMCNKFNITQCYLVPPGCGLGGLSYEKQVRPVISQILDSRFTVVLKP